MKKLPAHTKKLMALILEKEEKKVKAFVNDFEKRGEQFELKPLSEEQKRNWKKLMGDKRYKETTDTIEQSQRITPMKFNKNLDAAPQDRTEALLCV